MKSLLGSAFIFPLSVVVVVFDLSRDPPPPESCFWWRCSCEIGRCGAPTGPEAALSRGFTVTGLLLTEVGCKRGSFVTISSSLISPSSLSDSMVLDESEP